MAEYFSIAVAGKANRLAGEKSATSRLNQSVGPATGSMRLAGVEPYMVAGAGAALAAGFLAVVFLAAFAPFFFGDFLAAGLAAFFFLAIENDSFTSKRPSQKGRLSRGRYRSGRDLVVANSVDRDAVVECSRGHSSKTRQVKSR